MCLATSDIRTGRLVRLRRRLRCAVAAVAFGLVAAQSPAQCVEQQKLTASDASGGDGYGISVSLSGDTVVVGARFNDCAAGRGCGAAYVYRFDGTSWVEEQELFDSEGRAGDSFGNSVSLSGNTVVVGALYGDCGSRFNCGSTYVFRFDGTTWVEEQKLTASDAAVGDGFGTSVSVSGDTVVVGAHLHDCAAGEKCGSAYIYRFDGTSWVEVQRLSASDAAAGGFFGASVSVSGDTLVVGAMRNDCVAGSRCGSAYIYRFNGTAWAEEYRLTASDAGAGDLFGRSVSVSEDVAVVGHRSMTARRVSGVDRRTCSASMGLLGSKSRS